MPNMAVLHEIMEAFAWMEEHYASCEAGVIQGRPAWVISVSDDDNPEPVEGIAGSFLDAFDRLQGKLAGTVPLDDSDLEGLSE